MLLLDILKQHVPGDIHHQRRIELETGLEAGLPGCELLRLLRLSELGLVERRLRLRLAEQSAGGGRGGCSECGLGGGRVVPKE